ncbi:flagellar assembly protein FliH [Bacillaceae bacterium S4-13-58]
MSNLSSTRVIGLKSIEIRQEGLHHDEETIENSKEKMMYKFQQAEQQLQNAQNQAESLIEKSKRQIEEERKQWEVEKEEQRKKAIEDGFQEGYQHGQKKAYEDYKSSLQFAQDTIDEARVEYLNIINQSEETILALGIKIASKITRLLYEDKPETFTELIKHAIREIEDQPQIKIFVHPKYYSFVIEQKDELLAIVNPKAELLIYPHDELNSEGCYIESPIGRIDASIDTQLLHIREKLFELIEEEKG